MGSAPTLRAYRAGDETRIRELFESTFGKRRSLASWRWQFESAPAGRARNFLLQVVIELDRGGLPCAPLVVGYGPERPLLLVGEVGRLLPDRQVVRAATAVAELLSSPSARRELQERGWRLAGRCEPATVLSRLEALYEATVAGGRTRTAER